MKRMLSLILALASLFMLFACKTYAQESEPPAVSGEPGRALTAGTDAPVPESEWPDNSYLFREVPFSDVEPDDWFYGHVKNAYDLGIMAGEGDGIFAPLDTVSLAEAVTMAAKLRSEHTGDYRNFYGGTPWYAPAVEYAVAQGIIQEGDFPNYMASATRTQFAYILSRALPSDALEEVNTVEDNSLPDVRMSDPYAENIYLLYRAGIISGRDAKGTFSPSSTLTRAEAAGITSRIADPSLRVECTYYAPVYPDLSLRDRADDSFFSDTAVLGNSLIVGLSAYSKLKTPDYYCVASMSVISAMNSKSIRLNNGAYGTYLDAMAQKQYGKVYIELGINEIYLSTSSFISYYRTMLNKIRASQPNAEIYIMAVTPTSRAKNGTSYNRDKVIAYNTALRQLAADWGCYYLDVFTPLADSEGYLPSSQTWDGVHFTVSKYAEWETVIRTYYA